MINVLVHTLKKNKLLLFLAAVFLIVSFAATIYKSYTYSPQKVQQTLTQKIQQKEQQFQTLINNKPLLTNVISHNIDANTKTQLTNLPFGFYVYKKSNKEELIYWNSNKYAIPNEELSANDGSYFKTFQNGNFEVVKATATINNQLIICVGIIPVRWHYFIENKYLNSSFSDFPEIEDLYEITSDSKGFTITNIYNKPLFSLQKKKDENHFVYNWFTITLRIAAILCFLILINRLSVKLVEAFSFKRGFLFLCVAIVLIRFCSYQFPFPFDFSNLPLFDPSIYASNFLHPSLGDLLINSILLFWLITFYKFNTLNNFHRVSNKLIAYISLIALTGITIFFTNIVRSLVLDSKISFDVSNFFSLTIYSVVSFIILCFCVINFYHLSHILLRNIFAEKVSLFIQLAFVASTGLLYLSITIQSPFVLSTLLILLWLLLYVVLINRRKQDIELAILKSSVGIFWIMFFAASTAVLVMYQNNYTELEQRKKWAEKLALQADPESENLLKIATTNFNDEFLTKNFNRFNQEFSNKFIKDSLVNENFSGYLNKYDTRIYIFDSLFKPLFNDDSASYAVIKTTILNQAKETSINSLYTYNSSNEKQGYIYEKIIASGTNTYGYLFVTVKPKRYKSEALYPELFRQVQDLSSDFNINYAYAIYVKGKLINRFNDYNFPSTLSKTPLPLVKFEQRTNGTYNELWHNTGSGKIVVITHKKSLAIELITLFAYLFCTFLLVITLFHLATFLLRLRFNKQAFQSAFQLNIRTQIHATIIFISIFSFVIIGIATISFFIYRFNQSNQDRLSKSIQVMGNEIEEKLKIIQSQLSFDDVLNINDVGFGSDVEKRINEISEIHNVDVNFYNIAGNLIASTQPYIYNKHLLNNKMEPNAFYELNGNKSIQYIQSEKIAGFSYLSIYIPVNDENGTPFAYLNIPYLNSQAELNQEISGFLATLINLNAFIFLLAGAIAYLATERIASSFSLISNKMKEVNLGKHNEFIEWNRNDEIGVLVKEYNKMVEKLELSAQALAQSEREGAWREMARQVAHEIKNPLTPMKLSIQYLQKSIDNNQENARELTYRVATTLIEQIEQLSKIAGDFSQFANIGNTHLEVFELTDVLVNLIQLHSIQEKVTIEYEKPQEQCLLYADKVQISRLFGNLILNAIEACDKNEQAVIHIHQQNILNEVQVTIKDNGSGIDDVMKEKIFTPNFTTKTSGTGLGLAICKGIAEKANGNIKFMTEKNKGTSFIVTLPLHKNK